MYEYRYYSEEAQESAEFYRSIYITSLAISFVLDIFIVFKITDNYKLLCNRQHPIFCIDKNPPVPAARGASTQPSGNERRKKKKRKHGDSHSSISSSDLEQIGHRQPMSGHSEVQMAQ